MKITLQFLKLCCMAALLAPAGSMAQQSTAMADSEGNAKLTMNVVKKPLENDKRLNNIIGNTL